MNLHYVLSFLIGKEVAYDNFNDVSRLCTNMMVNVDVADWPGWALRSNVRGRGPGGRSAHGRRST